VKGVGDALFVQPSWTEREHSLVYIRVWNRELFLTERSRKWQPLPPGPDALRGRDDVERSRVQTAVIQ
jgi:hypothetical protein